MNITDVLPQLGYTGPDYAEKRVKEKKAEIPAEQLMCRNRRAGDVFTDRRGAKYLVNARGMHIKLVDKYGKFTLYGRLAEMRGQL